MLELEALWIALGSAVGCTLWICWQIDVALFAAFTGFAAFGIGGHLLFQRRSLRSEPRK